MMNWRCLLNRSPISLFDGAGDFPYELYVKGWLRTNYGVIIGPKSGHQNAVWERYSLNGDMGNDGSSNSGPWQALDREERQFR
jgi:hypothetical protein